MKRPKKRITLIISLALIGGFLSFSALYAADTKSTSNVTISVQSVFSLEFYTDANVLYSSTIPFTNVDPNESIAYPDGRFEDDGKSDAGVICRSNAGVPWQLKLHLEATPPLTPDKMRYYIGQPFNRNTGEQADGTLSRSPDWYPFQSTPTTVYTAGFKDQSNLPFGTLATISYSLIPTGLDAGQGYSADIVYTMTTSS